VETSLVADSTIFEPDSPAFIREFLIERKARFVKDIGRPKPRSSEGEPTVSPAETYQRKKRRNVKTSEFYVGLLSWLSGKSSNTPIPHALVLRVSNVTVSSREGGLFDFTTKDFTTKVAPIYVPGAPMRVLDETLQSQVVDTVALPDLELEKSDAGDSALDGDEYLSQEGGEIGDH